LEGFTFINLRFLFLSFSFFLCALYFYAKSFSCAVGGKEKLWMISFSSSGMDAFVFRGKRTRAAGSDARLVLNAKALKFGAKVLHRVCVCAVARVLIVGGVRSVLPCF
jgi:hypothetical protein